MLSNVSELEHCPPIIQSAWVKQGLSLIPQEIIVWFVLHCDGSLIQSPHSSLLCKPQSWWVPPYIDTQELAEVIDSKQPPALHIPPAFVHNEFDCPAVDRVDWAVTKQPESVDKIVLEHL